jgi:hypothetical protein
MSHRTTRLGPVARLAAGEPAEKRLCLHLWVPSGRPRVTVTLGLDRAGLWFTLGVRGRGWQRGGAGQTVHGFYPRLWFTHLYAASHHDYMLFLQPGSDRVPT